jgi:hypothetical protein
MKSAALIGLVVAAAGLAAVTAFVVRPRSDEGIVAVNEEQPFIQGLASNVNNARTVEVKSGDKQFTIRQDEAGIWRMADKGDYPASIEKVKQAVAGLADLRGGEPKTSRPELYSKIGVQDPGTPTEAGERAPALLTLKDGGGQVLASVIVGNSKYGSKPGVYIRRAGEAQSWLALGSLDIPGEPTAWMETKLLELPRDRVKSVTVTHASGEVLTVSRNATTDTSFAVQNVPEGKELRSPNAGDPLAAGLSYLQFEDVMPASAFKTEGEGAAALKWTADYRTFDGLVLVIQSFDKGGKAWARFVTSYDASAAGPAENRPAGLKPAEDVQKEVADLSAKLSPWTFQLPEWKATALGATMTSLLKETPPPTPPSLTGATGTTGAPAPAAPPPPPAPPAPAPTGAAPPAPTGSTGITGTTGPTGPTAPTGEPRPGE